MSTLAAISAVLSVGLITYASRAGLIVFLADRPLPTNITRALRYVGPAVLSALTVNLIAGGQGIDGVEGVEVAAIATAVVVAALARNLIAALVAGMGMPSRTAVATTRRQPFWAVSTACLKNGSSSRLIRPASASKACLIFPRKAERIMQPPRHISAMPP